MQFSRLRISLRICIANWIIRNAKDANLKYVKKQTREIEETIRGTVRTAELGNQSPKSRIDSILRYHFFYFRFNFKLSNRLRMSQSTDTRRRPTDWKPNQQQIFLISSADRFLITPTHHQVKYLTANFRHELWTTTTFAWRSIPNEIFINTHIILQHQQQQLLTFLSLSVRSKQNKPLAFDGPRLKMRQW